MSITKAQIKLIQKLEQKKFRQKYRLFCAEGIKPVSELLQNGLKATAVYATEKSSQSFSEAQIITEAEMKLASRMETPPGVLALFEIPETTEKNLADFPLALLLDGIRDPGNLGTIIRIADWYGLLRIFCSPDCVDAWNPKVVQASMGSAGRVAVQESNLPDLIKESRRKDIYAATLNGEPLKKVHKAAGVLIIGSESHGISPEVLALAPNKISIERYGRAESLNAAIATGILLDRIVRGE